MRFGSLRVRCRPTIQQEIIKAEKHKREAK